MSSVWNQLSTAPDSANPPTKRRKTQRRAPVSPSDDGNRSDTGDTGPPLAHTRVIVACKACRARKTKCDGARPACAFCANRKIVCDYDELPSQFAIGFQPLGSQILDAIENLTDLVRDQNKQPQQLPARHGNSCHCSYGVQHSVATTPGDHYAPSPVDSNQRNPCLRNEEDIGSEVEVFREGLQSILRWPVFPPELQLVPICEDKIIQSPLSQTLPPLEYSELIRFEARYIVTVHTKNPMLDLRDLRCKISQVSESGLDWSTNTCLVALVCAIGALCDPHGFDETNEAAEEIRKRDTEVASLYWNVASKRMGLVVGENSLDAVQCLCLAGIWYICNFQPLQAWKYFTMAGNCWYLGTIIRHPMSTSRGNLSLKSIEQATFFTSYKSELELRFELGIKGSVLDHFDSPHSFPLPPNLDDPRLQDAASEQERTGWYYYLSEIAARHLINRILKTRSRIEPHSSSARRLRFLLADLEIYQGQLGEWYRSLPSRISFPLPNDSGEPIPDDFKQILRSRFMFTRDLYYRPFIELCLNWPSDLPDDMMEKVAGVASEGLQNCVWRLQFMSCHRAYSQGLWFMIRAAVSCAMILIGAVKAQRDSTLKAAALLRVPSNWQQQILRVLDILSPFSQELRGGVKECIQIATWALDDLVS